MTILKDSIVTDQVFICLVVAGSALLVTIVFLLVRCKRARYVSTTTKDMKTTNKKEDIESAPGGTAPTTTTTTTPLQQKKKSIRLSLRNSLTGKPNVKVAEVVAEKKNGKDSCLVYVKPPTRSTSLADQTSKSSEGQQHGHLGEVIYATKNFKPGAPDEVGLLIGDPVAIYKTFDDQWYEGMNWRKNLSGFFPKMAFDEQ